MQLNINDNLNRHISIVDYHSAKARLAEICLNAGISEKSINYFGEISDPGISDLDAYVEGTKSELNAVDESFDLECRRSDKFAYIFAHQPVYVLATMRPLLRRLHTLESAEESKFELPSSSILYVVWFTFVLTALIGVARSGSATLRQLLLLYKNLERSSLYFTGASVPTLTSKELRTLAARLEISLGEVNDNFWTLASHVMEVFDTYCSEKLGAYKVSQGYIGGIDREILVDARHDRTQLVIGSPGIIRTNRTAGLILKAVSTGKGVDDWDELNEYVNAINFAAAQYRDMRFPLPFITPFGVKLGRPFRSALIHLRARTLVNFLGVHK